MADFQDISDIVTFSRNALELVKSSIGLMPKGADREKAEAQIKAAEEALQRSDAKLAKELGYSLCKCTFPPQVMLSEGYHTRHKEEISRCPKCGKQEPPEQHFRARDEIEAQSNEPDEDADWIKSRY